MYFLPLFSDITSFRSYLNTHYTYILQFRFVFFSASKQFNLLEKKRSYKVLYAKKQKCEWYFFSTANESVNLKNESIHICVIIY